MVSDLGPSYHYHNIPRCKDLMAEPGCLYLVDCFIYIGGGLTVNFLPALLFLTANCKAQTVCS